VVVIFLVDKNFIGETALKFISHAGLSYKLKPAVSLKNYRCLFLKNTGQGGAAIPIYRSQSPFLMSAISG